MENWLKTSQVPLVIKQKDELGLLAQDFNRLKSLLEQQEELRKQWLADIAHELAPQLVFFKLNLRRWKMVSELLTKRDSLAKIRLAAFDPCGERSSLSCS